MIAKDWDNELNKCLERKKAYFENLKIAAAKVEGLLRDGEAIEDVEATKLELEVVLDNAFPQLQVLQVPAQLVPVVNGDGVIWWLCGFYLFVII